MMSDGARKADKGKGTEDLKKIMGADSRSIPSRELFNDTTDTTGGPTVRGDVAIIGMACVFPGAPDLQTFWHNILSKKDAVIDVPPRRWDAGMYFSEDADDINKVYCKRGGYLDEFISFDPVKHGVMPRGVEGGEPDQFLVLQVVHEALKDAESGTERTGRQGDGETRGPEDKGTGRLGDIVEAASSRLDTKETRGQKDNSPVSPSPRPLLLSPNQRTEFILGRGNYLGVGASNLIQRSLVTEQTLKILKNLHPEYTKEELIEIRKELLGSLPRFSADSAPAFIPNLTTGRVANRLDFMGPNFTVDAACASSLIATEIGVRDLLTGKCDLAISGGVHIFANVPFLLIFCAFQAMSLTSSIRPFDQDADGTLPGEGVGVVVLKRLADAVRDGNRIYSVIKGIGIASDGRAVSVTAPRVEGEELALRRAYEIAEVEPRTVRLIEAHGVGTAVGDVVEVQAMTRVFGSRATGAGPRCALGTVKSMIGHAMPAAGIAGLIKASLSLYHKVLPPTLHCKTVNPKLEIEKTPFYLNTETRPWIHGETEFPRRAGVNAFGFGGINAHAVMEEYREKQGFRDLGVRDLGKTASDDPLQPNPLSSPLQPKPLSLPESTPGIWETEVCIFSGASRSELIRQIHHIQAFLISDAVNQNPQGLLRDLAYSLNTKLMSMEGVVGDQGSGGLWDKGTGRQEDIVEAASSRLDTKETSGHEDNPPLPPSPRLPVSPSSLSPSLPRPAMEKHASLKRLAVVASSTDDLQEKLAYALKRLADPDCHQIKDLKGIYFFDTPLSKEGKVAFLFPGEGAQYVNMLADLCIYFPEVRACFDRTDQIVLEQAQEKERRAECAKNSAKCALEKPAKENAGCEVGDAERNALSTTHYAQSLADLPSFNIFPPPSFSEEERLSAENRLWRMDRATEAVLTGNLAMHTLLTGLGIKPDQMMGHSAGEWSAMVFSGIIDTEEFLHNTGRLNRIYRKLNSDPDIPKATLIAVGTGLSQLVSLFDRGGDSEKVEAASSRLKNSEGSEAANVGWDLCPTNAGGKNEGSKAGKRTRVTVKGEQGIGEAAKSAPVFGNSVSIPSIGLKNGPLYVADDNCPHQVVMSAEEEVAEEAMGILRARAIPFEKLPFNRGYHTPLFTPICSHLREYFSSFSLSRPKVEIYSCTTMAPYPKEPDEILELAVKTWVLPVAFRQTVENMYDSGTRIFIEAGPRGNLTAFVEDILRGKPHLAVPSNVMRRSGITQLNHLVGMLSAQGVPLNLGYLYQYRLPRVLTDLLHFVSWAEQGMVKAPWPTGMGTDLKCGTDLPFSTPIHDSPTDKKGCESEACENAPAIRHSDFSTQLKAKSKGVEIKLPLGLYSLTVKERVEKKGINQEKQDIRVKDNSGVWSMEDASKSPDSMESTAKSAETSLNCDPSFGFAASITGSGEKKIIDDRLPDISKDRGRYPASGISEHTENLKLKTDNAFSSKISPDPPFIKGGWGDCSMSVMQQYLKTMGHFLDTQKEMMQAYLERKETIRMKGKAVLNYDLEPKIPAPPQKKGEHFPPVIKGDCSMSLGLAAPIGESLDDGRRDVAGYTLEEPLQGNDISGCEVTPSARNSEKQPSQEQGLLSVRGTENLSPLRHPDTGIGTNTGMRADVQSVSIPYDMDSKSGLPASVGTIGNRTVISEEELTGIMLDLVSEKTGYPREMIDLNLDMEGDLGIDSIKRVEIIGSFRSQYPLVGDEDVEAISSLKTIQQILDFLKKKVNGAVNTGPNSCPAGTEGKASSKPVSEKVLPFVGTIADLKPGKSITILREVDLQEDLFLEDHRFGQKISGLDASLNALPVVPMTVSIEIMAEAASLLFPGKKLIRAERVGASQWICLEKEEPVALRITAEVTAPGGQEAIVRVYIEEQGIRDLGKTASPDPLQPKPLQPKPLSLSLSPSSRADQKAVITGRMVFAESYPPSCPAPEFILQDERDPSHTAEQIYRLHRMFHGPRFQGIASMDRVGKNGLKAHLMTLPVNGLFRSMPGPANGPASISASGPASRSAGGPVPELLTDPFLLDAAGQLVGYWPVEYLETGFVIFPIALESLRIYGPTPPPFTRLYTRMRLREVTGTQVRADLDIIDDKGQLLMQLIGWQDWRFYWSRELYDFWRFPVGNFVGRLSEKRVVCNRLGETDVPFSGKKKNSGVRDHKPEEKEPCPVTVHCSFMRQFWRGEADMFRHVMAYMVLSRREREIYHSLPSAKQQGAWMLERMAAKDAVRSLLKKYELYPADISIIEQQGIGGQASSASVKENVGWGLCPTDTGEESVKQNAFLPDSEFRILIPGKEAVPSLSLAHTDNAAIAVTVESGLDVGVSIASVSGHRESSSSVPSVSGKVERNVPHPAPPSPRSTASMYLLTPAEETLLTSVLEKSTGCEVRGAEAEQNASCTSHNAQSLHNHIAMRFRCAKEAVARALGLSHLNYCPGSKSGLTAPMDAGAAPCRPHDDRGEGIVINEYDVQTGGIKVSLREKLMEEFPGFGTGPIQVHTALEKPAQEMDPSATGEYLIAIAVIEKQKS